MLDDRENWKRIVLERLKTCGVSLHLPSESDPDFWFLVACQIAFDFIPGFKYPAKRRGRPTVWNENDHSALITAVKGLPHLSELSACIWLTKNGDFKGIDAKTLYRRLHFAKKQARKSKYSELARILAGVPTLEKGVGG
jgi:hypothetical protein